MATVAITDEYIEFMDTHPTPDWPFNEATCPVCKAVEQLDEPPAWPKGQPRPLP